MTKPSAKVLSITLVSQPAWLLIDIHNVDRLVSLICLYRLLPENFTFEAASQACVDLDAKLASAESDLQIARLAHLVSGKSERDYIILSHNILFDNLNYIGA